MSKQKNKGLVPELRFPEFRDKGEWELAPLKKLASKRTERNRDGKLVRVLTNSAEHGVVDQRDYFNKDIAIQGNLENYFIVDRGDFVYNPRISAFAPVGPISKNSVAKGVMSPLYSVFRFKNSDIDFYAHYFKSSAWHLHMRQVGSTGARHDRMAITNDDFLAMPLPVPSPEEQQKIAACLSSFDDLITAQIQKLDALKTHKNGLMQQLFPAEGETVPKRRFPEFREAGEWEQKPLSALVKSLDAGVSVNSGDRPANRDESGILKTSAVTVGVFEPSENKVVTDIDELRRLKEPVLKNTIIISRMNTPALVGANAYIEASHDNLFLPDRLWAAKPKPGTSMRFIAYILGGGQGRAALSALATGTSDSMKNISKSAVLEIQVLTPSAEEQQKIADCLTSIDELITVQTKKIDALKAHNKGLLQQLFPAMDKVSA